MRSGDSIWAIRSRERERVCIKPGTRCWPLWESPLVTVCLYVGPPAEEKKSNWQHDSLSSCFSSSFQRAAAAVAKFEPVDDGNCFPNARDLSPTGRKENRGRVIYIGVEGETHTRRFSPSPIDKTVVSCLAVCKAEGKEENVPARGGKFKFIYGTATRDRLFRIHQPAPRCIYIHFLFYWRRGRKSRPHSLATPPQRLFIHHPSPSLSLSFYRREEENKNRFPSIERAGWCGKKHVNDSKGYFLVDF